MAYVTQTRMVIGYDNVVTPELVTTVTLTNITPDQGFPADNLKYDDPKLVMRTAGTVAHPNNRVIRFDFLSAVTISCCGIVNHDLVSAGYETIMVEWSSDGTNWTNVGTGTVSLANPLGGNQNFLIRFDPVAGPTRWRVTLGKASGTRPAFRIGMIFLGQFYTLVKQPIDGQVLYPSEVQLDFIDSLGGDRWLAPGGTARHEEAEVSWSRMTQQDYQTVAWKIGARNARRIIAIVGPEQSTSQMPIGHQHFFGYLLNDVPAARDGFATGNHRYDYTMRLMGAV